MERSRTLEITLQYANDLSKPNLMISKMEVYAVVSISGGDNNSHQKTKTPADHDGGRNPSWGNFPMKFSVDEAALQQNRLVLDIKLMCKRGLSLFGDKEIGQVNVPVKELVDFSATKNKKFVSYQVRRPCGRRPKGHLTFSYRFIGKVESATVESGGSYYPPLPPPGYWYQQPLPGYYYYHQSLLNYGYLQE